MERNTHSMSAEKREKLRKWQQFQKDMKEIDDPLRGMNRSIRAQEEIGEGVDLATLVTHQEMHFG